MTNVPMIIFIYMCIYVHTSIKMGAPTQTNRKLSVQSSDKAHINNRRKLVERTNWMSHTSAKPLFLVKKHILKHTQIKWPMKTVWNRYVYTSCDKTWYNYNRKQTQIPMQHKHVQLIFSCVQSNATTAEALAAANLEAGENPDQVEELQRLLRDMQDLWGRINLLAWCCISASFNMVKFAHRLHFVPIVNANRCQKCYTVIWIFIYGPPNNLIASARCPQHLFCMFLQNAYELVQLRHAITFRCQTKFKVTQS